MRISFELPLRADRNQNARGHWAIDHKKRKAEKAAVAYRLHPRHLQPLLVVRLTRIAPRLMDEGDGLAGALKGVRDGVAARLGIDDGSPLVSWEYRQEQGDPKTHGVRVEILDPLTAAREAEEVRQVPRCEGCDDPTCRSCGGAVR